MDKSSIKIDEKEEEKSDEIFCKESTFKSIGVCDELCEILDKMGYKYPTKIQKETLPYALKGSDLIGVAETGSGKTLSYSLPILQSLLDTPKSAFYALVLAPTRELCLQIRKNFDLLGGIVGLKTCCLVGGLDQTSQAISLSKRPHIVVGTPGRVADHLSNTKGFSLRSLKFLVFDEADRLLDLDFERQINQILGEIPKDRRTYLFSATMTSKVQKLEKASLKNPVKIEINHKYTTVDTLKQTYIFIPDKHKETYLYYILKENEGKSIIVFVEKVLDSLKLTFLLRFLGLSAISINGKMSQSNRIGALSKFSSGDKSILVATDVASRGLDIPNVDIVINFDLPLTPKDYIHRVGRTARAGKEGLSVSFVTQYDVSQFQHIEELIGKKMEEFKTNKTKALSFYPQVLDGIREANAEMKEILGKTKTNGVYSLSADFDSDEGDEEKQFLERKRRNEKFAGSSFVRKKKHKK